MKRLPLFIFALTVLGSSLTGCAVYPEGPAVIAPAGHQRGHQDQDDEHDNDHERHRKHDRDRERDHEDK